MRIIIWTACRDNLPTFQNLQRRKVSVENKSSPATCQMKACYMHFGNVQTFDMLRNEYIPYLATCTQLDSFLEMVQYVAGHGQAEDLTKTSCMAQSLWGRRNLLLHENKNLSPTEAFEMALSVLHNHSLDTNKFDPVEWEAPPMDYLKLNMDGVVFLELQTVGVGAIV